MKFLRKNDKRDSTGATEQGKIKHRIQEYENRALWVYGIGSLLYILLAIFCIAQAINVFRDGGFDPWLQAQFFIPEATFESVSAIGQIADFGKKLYFSFIVFIVLIPMVITMVSFVRRYVRRRQFVYCSSAQYMRLLVEGKADEASQRTLERIQRELQYINRRCPNCQSLMWTPAEGLVVCPHCDQLV